MSPVSAVDSTQTFGQRVKNLRTKKGIRQVDLAEKAGLSWRHLIRIEQDAGGATKDSTVAALADALGVSRDDLTGGDDDSEARSMPLSRDEFALLGDLMSRLGGSLVAEGARS